MTELRTFPGSEERDRSLTSEIDMNSRFVLQLVYEFGIQFGARVCKRAQKFGSVGIAVGKHTGGSRGSLASGLAAFYDEHFALALGKLERTAEAYDTSADNDRIPGLHLLIVTNRARLSGDSLCGSLKRSLADARSAGVRLLIRIVSNELADHDEALRSRSDVVGRIASYES